MAEDNKKTALIAGGLGLALLGVYSLVKKPIPPPEEPVAIIKIEVIGAGHHSPVELVEGESYTVRLTITNRSTKAGELWEVDLEVVIQAVTQWTVLIPVTASLKTFAAGQTRTFDYPLDVPVGTSGETGQITAVINDPTGVKLASAIEYFNIAEVEIIYGATIVIGA